MNKLTERIYFRRRQFNRQVGACNMAYMDYLDRGGEHLESRSLYTYEDISDMLYEMGLEFDYKVNELVLNTEEEIL